MAKSNHTPNVEELFTKEIEGEVFINVKLKISTTNTAAILDELMRLTIKSEDILEGVSIAAIWHKDTDIHKRLIKAKRTITRQLEQLNNELDRLERSDCYE